MRASIHEYMVSLLSHVAARSTCRRRAVAAIITDERGAILATGYNGVPSGLPHCTELVSPCLGVSDPPGDSSRCLAVHAEQNALLQCRELRDARVIYISCSPCFTCAKMILNTPIQTVVVAGLYPDQLGLNALRAGGRLVVEIP